MNAANQVGLLLLKRGIDSRTFSVEELKENCIAILSDAKGVKVFHFERGSHFWEREFLDAEEAADYVCELLGYPSKQ